MTERIMTLHPQGKKGVHIAKAKYDAVKDAILNILEEQEIVIFSELMELVGEKLPNFDGSIGWYTTSVKLDLEARDIIERLGNSSPQQIRLKN
ncbi:MAG: hypothetical protein Phog2KO_08820 [Phototrophicaceae bacterium]